MAVTKLNITISSIVWFYIIGAIGFILPLTHPYFVWLTPFVLILNFLVLIIYHQSRFDQKTILIMGLIFLLGFVIEAIGVNTGIIFGHYRYGSALGLKLFDTPLLIGLNWLFLTYATAAILSPSALPGLLRIPVAALLMVGFDLILEKVAPSIDMWYWQQGKIPAQNYIAWFLIALIFQLILHFSKIKIRNKWALPLFAAQFLFFVALYLIQILAP